MAREFSKSKYWLRNGRMNHKRFVEMEEEEIALIPRCTGEISGQPCRNHVFRCTVCGNYGCMHEMAEICSEQGFAKEACLNCGAADTYVPITG